MELRQYQQTMIEQARAHMRAGVKRILFVAPPGAGKTQLAAHMAAGFVARDHHCHFNCHRIELVEQTSETFRDNGLQHGILARGYPFNPFDLLLVNQVQLLARRLDRVRVPYGSIWDEAQHMAAATWREIYDSQPDAYHFGLSGTPERLDGSGLGEFFQVIVYGPTTADLIEMGYLSPYRYFAPGVPDMAGVPTGGGDFKRSGAAAVMDTPKLVGDVVEHYVRLAGGQKGVVFAVNREHSRRLADRFNAEGIAAAHIDGETETKDRKRMMGAFRAGDIRILVNVDLFGEGVNVPDMVYCGLARPTKSLTLCEQQRMRSMRTFPGKEQAIIADHAGNCFLHGLPDDRREWTLEGRKAKGRAAVAQDATPIHQCPACYQVTYSNRVTCPCGHVFAAKDRMPGWEAGELMPLERGADAKVLARLAAADARKAEERACTTAAELIALAQKRGYPKPAGWASLTLRKRSKSFWARGGFQQRRAG